MPVKSGWERSPLRSSKEVSQCTHQAGVKGPREEVGWSSLPDGSDAPAGQCRGDHMGILDFSWAPAHPTLGT